MPTPPWTAAPAAAPETNPVAAAAILPAAIPTPPFTVFPISLTFLIQNNQNMS